MSLPPVYVPQVNVPGYMPMADDSPAFDTPGEAWAYLVAERERDLGDPMNDEGDAPDDCLEELDGWVDSPDVGTVYGRTPGYDGDHDLGLAYSVRRMDHAAYPHHAGYLVDCAACESHCHCDPGHAPCVYQGEHS